MKDFKTKMQYENERAKITSSFFLLQWEKSGDEDGEEDQRENGAKRLRQRRPGEEGGDCC